MISTRLLTLSPPEGDVQFVDEASAKAMLSNAGISVPSGATGSVKELRDLAADLDFPVVLKMIGPGLIHKTEAGAIALNLLNPDALADAAVRIRQNVSRRQPDALTDLFLVEHMQPAPIAELLVSIRRDPQFGLALTLGSGGILVELVGDSETVLLPAPASDIASAIERLRVATLLRGFRGAQAVEMSKLVDAIERIAIFAVGFGPEFEEIEINPLFVYQDRVCAVDAVLRTYSTD